MRRRVVVVDDHELRRRGFTDTLLECPAVEVVASLSHRDASSLAVEWDTIDVVVVDAADPSRDDDQFPGVQTVRDVRGRQRLRRATVIVVTGHFLHDGLRRRMQEAGADFFYYGEELRTKERLLQVVLHPERERAGVPSVRAPHALAAVGVTRQARVNAALDYIAKQRLVHELRGSADSRTDPRSRRWRRIREGVSRAGHLVPVNIDGIPPRRDQQSVPSISQLQRFFQRFARIDPDEHGSAPE